MHKRRDIAGAAVLAATLVAALLAPGCSKPADDGIPPAEKQQANRLDQISKASGGDWDKLSESDRAYLLNDIAHGDERAARMILAGKSGRLRGNPGGGGTPPSVPASPPR